MGWDGKERRTKPRLTDEEKREIALEVWELFQLEVGKGAIKFVLYVCGAMCLAGVGYLVAVGKMFK